MEQTLHADWRIRGSLDGVGRVGTSAPSAKTKRRVVNGRFVGGAAVGIAAAAAGALKVGAHVVGEAVLGVDVAEGGTCAASAAATVAGVAVPPSAQLPRRMVVQMKG